jgi:zinc protease
MTRAERLDRSAPPPGGPRHRVAFPPFERETLSNGLELVVASRPGVPLVDLALLLPAGGDRNPEERPGLAALVASLADEGSDRRSGLEIATEVERLGGGLASHADWNSAQVEISLLADDLERALEILFEVATLPAFPAGEVERLRSQTLTELERRRDQPALLAEEALADLLYRGTRYGHLLQGNRASLSALERSEIVSFHAACYRSAGSRLVVVGEVEAAGVRTGVERVFGGWTSGAATAPALPDPARAERRVVIVDRPEGAQTELRIGQVGPPRTDPDRTRLGVLNALLGGKFTSRLNLNLREKRGFTYGVTSRFVDRRGPGPFVVAAAVANESVGAAVAETYAELARLLDEPVTAAELDETKSYLLGVFPYTLQTNGGILARLADIALYGLPSNHFERALAEIEATTADDLLGLARRHLTPERSGVVAVGPAALLAPQLERFGAVEVRAPAEGEVS